MPIDRRSFNTGLAVSAGALAFAAGAGPPARAAAYGGPNVIIVRFGGGVRRTETIDPANTWAPYLMNSLAARGVLIPDVRIADIKGMDTSHAEGTINILTGRYAAWSDAGSTILTAKIEPTSPTLFEYLRKSFDIAPHQALLINGENRPQEEFFSFARHRHFGGDFRAEVLSLYRYKRWLYRHLSTQGGGDSETLSKLGDHLAKIERYELPDRKPRDNDRLDRFWADWRRDYRDSGLINPRGDRLLTELALRAMRELHPRLMMINYQDPDYVHWGNASHYTRAIAIIDDGLRRLVEAADRLDHYAGRTTFVVVPDCGRDFELTDRHSLPASFQQPFCPRDLGTGVRSRHRPWPHARYGEGPGSNRRHRRRRHGLFHPSRRGRRHHRGVLMNTLDAHAAAPGAGRGRLSRVVLQPLRFILVVVLCLTPVGAVLVLGWLTRKTRRDVAQRMAGRGPAPWPRLAMSDDPTAGTWLGYFAGGLFANAVAGLKSWLAVLLLTAPFTAAWLTGWVAGWENSFNKGYELAGVWPLVTVMAVVISLPVWSVLPMAVAHQAVTGRLSAAFAFADIARLIRASGWRYVGLTLLIAVGCIGVFGTRVLPVFAQNVSARIATGDPEAVAAFARQYALFTTAALVLGLLVVRNVMARVYAHAAQTLATGRHASLITTIVVLALSVVTWAGIAFLVFTGQFLNYAWWSWINQPILMLPWLGVMR